MTLVVLLRDKASAELRKVSESTRELTQRAAFLYKETQVGSRVTKELSENAQRLNRDLTLQQDNYSAVRRAAIASMGTWRLVGDSFNRIAAVGNTLSGVFTQMNAMYTRMTLVARNLHDANIELAKAEDDVRIALENLRAAEESGDPRAISEARAELKRAYEAEQQAVKRLRDTQEELRITEDQTRIQQIAFGLSFLDLVPAVVTSVIGLKMLGATLSLVGAGTALVTTGIFAAAAALGIGLGAAVRFRMEMDRWPQSIGEVAEMFKTWPPILREIGTLMTLGFSGWGKFFTEMLPAALATALRHLVAWWSNIQTGFGRWLEGLGGQFAAGFNAIVSIVRGGINAAIGFINRLIDALNTIRIEIPPWVPGLGGQMFGISLGRIPELAEGGVVTRPTLALLGEAGPEVVLPVRIADLSRIPRAPYSTVDVGRGITSMNVTMNFAVPDETMARRVSEIIYDRLWRLTR